MKTLVLDYSKWRCGDNGENRLGEGNTSLLNMEGFMCCLGQFSLQLDKDVTEELIIKNGNPHDISITKRIPLLTKKDNKYGFKDTAFSENAIKINDDAKSTPDQKISKLRSLIKKYKYKLKVINKK